MLENAVAFWVGRFYEASRRSLYRAFREHDLDITPEQWLVLVRLWQKDGRSQRDLATAIERDAPTTSRIVDAMERSGLVARTANPDDARGKLISLTPRAAKLQKTLVPVVKKLVAAMEAGVSESDLEITMRTLEKLTANLQ